MSNSLTILVNGSPVEVQKGSTVAAALLTANEWRFRNSVCGEPRSALCGMGICFECRVTVNGVSNIKSCLVAVREGMTVETL